MNLTDTDKEGSGDMSIVGGLNERGVGTLPGLIGLEILEAEKGRLKSRLELREELIAPNGYLHAATMSRSPTPPAVTEPS